MCCHLILNSCLLEVVGTNQEVEEEEKEEQQQQQQLGRVWTWRWSLPALSAGRMVRSVNQTKPWRAALPRPNTSEWTQYVSIVLIRAGKVVSSQNTEERDALYLHSDKPHTEIKHAKLGTLCVVIFRWAKDRRVLLVKSLERGKWVQVRPLPNKSPLQYDVGSHWVWHIWRFKDDACMFSCCWWLWCLFNVCVICV